VGRNKNHSVRMRAAEKNGGKADSSDRGICYRFLFYREYFVRVCVCQSQRMVQLHLMCADRMVCKRLLSYFSVPRGPFHIVGPRKTDALMDCRLVARPEEVKPNRRNKMTLHEPRHNIIKDFAHYLTGPVGDLAGVLFHLKQEKNDSGRKKK
jgi:hypothetical protein